MSAGPREKAGRKRGGNGEGLVASSRGVTDVSEATFAWLVLEREGRLSFAGPPDHHGFLKGGGCRGRRWRERGDVMEGDVASGQEVVVGPEDESEPGPAQHHSGEEHAL